MENLAGPVSGSNTDGITPFGLILPARIRFGRGEALAALPEIRSFGQRFLLVRGANPARAARLRDALDADGASVRDTVCDREPDLDMLEAALKDARDHAPHAVLAIGGGAVLDLGKALAALLPAPNPDPLEHLEVVGRGKPLAADPLPFIAIPTTAGTGSEATRNAVIGVPEHRRKVSLRDPRMMADIAIVDPSFTDGTPRAVTMASGLDAITQVIEPYLSNRANPVTDALCRDAIPRGISALGQLVSQGEDMAARDDLALVSHVSGIALSNAGLGAVHGIAGVLGGETGAAHGEICGQLLPPVLRALRRRAPDGSRTAKRVGEIEGWCRTGLCIGLDDLADWAREHGLAQPSVKLSRDDACEIAEKSQASSSMKPSPVEFSARDLAQMLEEAGWT